MELTIPTCTAPLPQPRLCPFQSWMLCLPMAPEDPGFPPGLSQPEPPLSATQDVGSSLGKASPLGLVLISRVLGKLGLPATQLSADTSG